MEFLWDVELSNIMSNMMDWKWFDTQSFKFIGFAQSSY